MRPRANAFLPHSSVRHQKTDSTLILAFGLENFVDFVSSLVVLWRFYCPHGCDEAKLAKLKKREERASVSRGASLRKQSSIQPLLTRPSAS